MNDSPTPRRAGRQGGGRRPRVRPFGMRGSGALHWLRVRRRWVRVGLGDGILSVTLRSGRVLTFPLDRVGRVLVGSEPQVNRRRVVTIHRLQIWPVGGRSIVLRVVNDQDDMTRYRALVHGIAIEMERRGALDRMRIGLPPLFALGTPVLVGVGLAGVSYFGTEEASMRATPMEDFILGGLLILLIVLATTGWTIRQGFHRRVRARADLDRFLGVP